MKNKQKALQILKERNELFLSNHCEKGTFFTDEGVVNGVCKPISADEMLNFMNNTVTLVIEAMSTDN